MNFSDYIQIDNKQNKTKTNPFKSSFKQDNNFK